MNEVRPNYKLMWAPKHIEKISLNYARAPYAQEVTRWLINRFLTMYDDLASLNMQLNTDIAREFGFQCRFVRSSDLGIGTKGVQRLVDICTALGATTYLSGTGAAGYMNDQAFEKEVISVQYSDYQPIPYRQCWGGFLPNLSVVDFICNCGFDFNSLYGKEE